MSAKSVRSRPRIIQRCAFCRAEIVMARGLGVKPTIQCAGCGRENISPLARLMLAAGKRSG